MPISEHICDNPNLLRGAKFMFLAELRKKGKVLCVNFFCFFVVGQKLLNFYGVLVQKQLVSKELFL